MRHGGVVAFPRRAPGVAGVGMAVTPLRLFAHQQGYDLGQTQPGAYLLIAGGAVLLTSGLLFALHRDPEQP